MKVIVYLSTTVNGLIAGEKDNVDWVFQNKQKKDPQLLRKSNHFIVGRKTYSLMPVEEFAKKNTYYIFTRKRNQKPKVDNAQFVTESPKKFMTRLKNEGAELVCVYGGAKLNATMMESEQVDEIILDIEPIAIGKGTNLFRGLPFEAKLTLLHLIELPGGTIRAHYKVKK